MQIPEWLDDKWPYPSGFVNLYRYVRGGLSYAEGYGDGRYGYTYTDGRGCGYYYVGNGSGYLCLKSDRVCLSDLEILFLLVPDANT